MQPLNYGFLAIIAVILTVSLVITIRRNRHIRKNGTEVNAVVSRIEEYDTIDSDGALNTTYTYYVQFQTKDGNTVEAALGKIFQKNYHVGDELLVMYLPDKPGYAVPVKQSKR